MRKLAASFRLTGPRARRRRLALAAGLVALIVIPATLVGASHRFSDVKTSAFYHSAVNAIANANITVGCTRTRYCPDSAVTRGQMAVFLNKLGALGQGTTPVADALSVNGNFIQGGLETFTLADVNPTECEETQAAEVGVNPFGSYTIAFQLYDTPPGIDPEDVNVQLQDSDAPADEDDNVFDVCFATLDGSNLPAGNYETYFNFVVFIGQGIFGGASASNSGASSSPAKPGR